MPTSNLTYTLPLSVLFTFLLVVLISEWAIQFPVWHHSTPQQLIGLRDAFFKSKINISSAQNGSMSKPSNVSSQSELASNQSDRSFLSKLFATFTTYKNFTMPGSSSSMDSPLINKNNDSADTASNSSTTHSRVALCITGNARTFHYIMVHENILKNVVAPLRVEQEVDIFFNIKISDNPRPGLPEENRNENATRKAILKFNPVVVHELNDTDNYRPRNQLIEDRNVQKTGNLSLLTSAEGNSRKVKRPSYCKPKPNIPMYEEAMTPHALHRGAQCLPLIEEREASTGVKYEWVYRTRPDVVFLDPIVVPSKLEPRSIFVNVVPVPSTRDFVRWWNSMHGKVENLSIPDIGDHFMAMRREDADVALDTVLAVEDCDFFEMPGERNSEAQVSYWLLSRGLKPVAVPWLWVLVRAKIGPECERVEQFYMQDAIQHMKNIERCEEFRKKFEWI